MAAKKRGLGRGLDALLGPSQTRSVQADHVAGDPAGGRGGEGDVEKGALSGLVLRQLPIEWIKPGRFQPRSQFDEEKLQELAASISVHGVMQPIIVRASGADSYEIVAGERRWRACQLAGKAQIPAIVREIDSQSQLAVSLIENIQRENLNAMEEALALQRLIMEFDLTHQQAADAVGKSRAAISNSVRLAGLGQVAAELLLSEQIDMGHARALLALEQTLQAQAARQIVAKGLTVRQAETLVKQLNSPQQAKEKQQQPKTSDIQHLEAQLSEKLGQRVSLKQRKNGVGQLIIGYNSLDELDGILSRFGPLDS
jgi:ParB family chromosome partitioning protein